MKIASLLREAADVLWPVACVGCGVSAASLCDACLTRWQPRRFALGEHEQLTALGDYDGDLKSAVLACKERGSVAATRRLGQALADGCPPADAVAIVPPSRAGVRRRGFHCVEWLAGEIARRRELQIVRMRFTTGAVPGTQKRRSRDERLSAARELEPVRRLGRASDFSGLRVLVVDDVVTTGATMLAAARAVQDAGADFVGGAAIARTVRRSGRNAD
ncbi:ComF family protein [Agrococcus casei]|uniref:ComF family protein n=1 Tax=Agrococcus casei TaxID=343512 RepID=UPI003F917030